MVKREAKLFAENFSNNSNLDGSVMSLPALHSRTYLKLHDTFITPKFLKKIITKIGLSKPSGPDCIPVVVLKNGKPEFLYILFELFNMCLKEPCF